MESCDEKLEEVEAVFKSFEGRAISYNPNPFQVACALELLKDEGRAVAATFFPGDGKTFIIMALAKYWAQMEEKVVICVLFDFLRDTMNEYKDNFLRGEMGSVEVLLVS